MKSLLLILGFLFFALWVAYFFYPNRTTSIHIALIVEVIFFMHSLMIKKSPEAKERPEAPVINHSVRETESV